MKRYLSALAICFTAITGIQAQDLQNIVETLINDPALSHACVGISISKGNGEQLAGHNSEKMLVPASNMKLITTGAALDHLGPDYRFRTDIGHDGYIKDGTLHGNLYIIGNGDPTLGSKDSIATDIGKTFRQWEDIIKAAGIQRIEGHVVGDGRWLDGMIEEPTWLWNDIGTYYGSGVTGLMFYENMQSFSVSPGSAPGEPVNIRPHYPECPWMEFRYDCTTGEKGTGDRLYMYTSDLAPVAEIRGTFGVDRGGKRVDCSNKYPEYTCAAYFTSHLKKKGITCTGEAGDFRLRKEWMKEEGDSVTILGSTYSPELDRIVFETNHASNNLFAETLLRTLGKEMRSSSSYDSSYVALNDVLEKMKLQISTGLHVQDGSGLSRQNYVSADFFGRFLSAMMESPHFTAYLLSLPSPGGNGTLSYNMKGYPESLRSRIRVKSGSMNGVRCYSGYILPAGVTVRKGQEIPEEVKESIIIFSILTNNCTSPNWKVRPLLDRLMADVARMY